MHIHIPATYPPESLVLFLLSACNVLIALFISRAGVLRREAARAQVQMPLDSGSLNAEGA